MLDFKTGTHTRMNTLHRTLLLYVPHLPVYYFNWSRMLARNPTAALFQIENLTVTALEFNVFPYTLRIKGTKSASGTLPFLKGTPLYLIYP